MITYFTGHSTEGNSAAGVRARFIHRSLIEEYEVSLLSSDKKMGTTFFKIANNKSSLIKRLLKEFLVGIEISSRLIFKKTDLIILSSPPFFTILICAFSLKLFRKRYLLDVRDIYPHEFLAVLKFFA